MPTRHRALRGAALAALVLSSVACTHGRPLDRGPARDGVASAHGSRAVLGYTEIVSYGLSGGQSLFEALERLRPEFLQARRTAPRAPHGRYPDVYIENMHAGGIEVLRTIPVGHVQTVRYIRPIDALIRYGMTRDHDAGVIVVTLGRH